MTQLPVVTNVRTPSVEKDFDLAYEAHDQIVISGDDALHTYAEAEEWDGLGSIGDPYIIQGYSISYDGDCIVLSDISLYFEIHGCVLNSSLESYSGTGMDWQNVTHGKVFDTVVYNKTYGMRLTDSPGSLVKGCTVYLCAEAGIWSVGSEGLRVETCEISSAGFIGVGLVTGSNNSVVVGTEIHNSQQNGVYVAWSHGCVIRESEIYDNLGSGVLMHFSDDCVIANNTIHDNLYNDEPACGIHLYRSHSCDILRNRLVENARNGIYLEESEYALIQDNTVHNNSDHGIVLYLSHHGEIATNNVTDNGWWPQTMDAQCGIYMDDSMDVYIHGNHIFNNTPCGITLGWSEYITVADNTIDSNTDYGVRNWNSDNVTVVINHVTHNGWLSIDSSRCGILMYGHDCRIEGNQVLNNSLSGIRHWGDRARILYNTVTDNVENGISSEECYDNVISHNIVTCNAVGIFVMNIGSNITDNVVCDNEQYGIECEASGNCMFVGNDIGWNGQNAIEKAPLLQNFWYNVTSQKGNYYSDFMGVAPYWIYNETGPKSPDYYAGYSLNVTPAESIVFEVSSGPEARTMVWPAQALHPGLYTVYVDGLYYYDDNWDGNDITVVIYGVGGGEHEVTMEVSHGLVPHSVNASVVIYVNDMTPPDWFGTPGDWVINEGDSFAALFAVSDHSGFDCFWTNDTAHFVVIWSAEDPTVAYGEVTNATTLSPGTYGIRVYVNDTYGNINFIELKLVVLANITTTTTTVSPPLDPALVLAIGGGAAVIVVVIVILSRRRG